MLKPIESKLVATIFDTATTSYSAPNGKITSSLYGKTIFTTAAFTAKLPNAVPRRGVWFRIINCVDATLIITRVDGAGSIIAGGDASSVAAKTCTFGTSSHKIGACVLVISNGTNWIVINQSAAEVLMTVGT